MDKLKVFEKELDYIKNPNILKYANHAIELLPDYYFDVPGSSSGKYHPSFALGSGGLVRHVRACIRIAVELFRMEMFNYFTEDEKDLVVVALLLHDAAKSGIPKQTHTVADHPLVIVEYLRHQPDLANILPEEYEDKLYGAITTHMGGWNKSYDGIEILPKPRTKFENFVHLVDYLGSRKILEMNFDVAVNRD